MNVKPIVDDKFELPTDGWVHGIPFCDAQISAREVNPDAGENDVIIQRNDQASIDAIISTFRRESAEYAKRVGAPFSGLLVDKEHFSYDTEKETEAQAWIMDMERRADGLWLQMRWTDVGRQRVTGGSFRFLSPTVLQSNCEVIESKTNAAGGKILVLRPQRVDSFALTNKHRLKLLKPISNRESDGTASAGNSQTPPAAEGTKESRMDYKAMLLAEYGLPPDATDEQLQKAIDDRKAAGQVAKGEADAMKSRLTTAEERVAQLERTILETQVEADLIQFADRIQNREETRKQLLVSRDTVLAVLKSVKAPAAAPEKDQRILSREAGSTAPQSAASDEAKIKSREEAISQYRLNNKDGDGKPVSYQRAWNAVRAQKPELFM